MATSYEHAQRIRESIEHAASAADSAPIDWVLNSPHERSHTRILLTLTEVMGRRLSLHDREKVESVMRTILQSDADMERERQMHMRAGADAQANSIRPGEL